MLIKQVFDKVIKRISPVNQELIEVDEIIKKVRKLLKKNNIDAEVVAGGSYAKKTILKNDFDVDLFVRFSPDYDDDEISDILGKALSSLKPERVHGSRDYFQMKRKGILFEIVPVLKISDYKQAINVTDMSPLHVDYAKKHLNDKMRNDVRLAKQFCKSIKVYGAESYIQGFSGHILDLLIIYYGSFEKLLMQATLWKEKVIIDINNHS